jgi:hypothetical protein
VSTEEGLRMSTQAGSAPSDRIWEGRLGYELFWNKLVQTSSDPDFVTVSLLSIAGLLISLSLTVLFDIPAAESLLGMPG